MKEAAGNLNATLVVVVAIGVLSAFFFSILWPKMQANNDRVMGCAEAICLTDSNSFVNVNGVVMQVCTLKRTGNQIQCPYKG